MEVIDRKPIPIYEVVCPECESTIRYKACEIVDFGAIKCPVCNTRVWVSACFPVAYEGASEQEQTAKWLWDRPHHFKCSNCEWFAGVSATMYSFCPNCGKKMEMSAGELMKEWPNSEVINV